MKRRQFLQQATAVAAMPLLSACRGDDPVVQIDNRLPVGPFDAESTAEEVTRGMDLTGKVALVTGCNSGLGYETMRVLALRGAHVLGTGRTLEKASEACASVSGSATPLVLELSSLQSAVDCARVVADLGLSPDILICNAGINTFGERELVNGIEKMFLVNFLGHFVLVNQLLPLMQRAAPGRKQVSTSTTCGARRNSMPRKPTVDPSWPTLCSLSSWQNASRVRVSRQTLFTRVW
jgi:NAD(P)-dependent dehydrogenase (short-subunit alcohol dehydrogenase family)